MNFMSFHNLFRNIQMIFTYSQHQATFTSAHSLVSKIEAVVCWKNFDLYLKCKYEMLRKEKEELVN